MRTLDAFYADLKEPVSSCLEALRTIILKHDPAMSEALKYGMPCFSHNKKMLCYFWIDKKNKMPYIGFKNGVMLRFPWLETGERTRFSIMYIDPYEDIPVKKIRQTLKALIDNQKSLSGKK